MEKKGSSDIKKIFIFSLFNSILLGGINTYRLMNNSFLIKERIKNVIKVLFRIIRPQHLNIPIYLLLEERAIFLEAIESGGSGFHEINGRMARVGVGEGDDVRVALERMDTGWTPDVRVDEVTNILSA